MKRWIAGVVVSLLLCACSGMREGGSASDESIIPQGKPVATLLVAVQKQDVDLLKSAYSARMRELIDKEGTWDKGLEAYTQGFRKEFGEYDLADFEYSFSGDGDAGKVSIVFQGETCPDLRVVREGDEWKLDEK